MRKNNKILDSSSELIVYSLPEFISNNGKKKASLID